MTSAAGTTCRECGAVNGGPSPTCLLCGTELAHRQIATTVLRLAYSRLFHALVERQRVELLTVEEIEVLDAARAVYDAAEAMERGI